MVFPPVLDDFKQPLVGMVPGVAGLIVRRGRKVTQWQALPPVGLAFEIDPVTAGTKAGVDLLPQGDVLSAVRAGRGCRGGVCARACTTPVSLESYYPERCAEYIANGAKACYRSC